MSTGRADRRPALMENLEGRRLLSINVSSIFCDNRGQTTVQLNPHGKTIDPATISKTSCLVYTTGPDGLLNTADDVRVPEAVYFNPNNNIVTLVPKLKAGTGYRVRLSATRIRTTDGEVLDGEYNKHGQSGDGQPGGDYNIQTKNDKSNTPLVRMNTSKGTVVVKMLLEDAPETVSYFVNNANNGLYDYLLVTRSTQGSNKVVAAGSIQIPQDDTYLVTGFGDGKQPESTGLTNVRGTIAMDRVPIKQTLEGNGFQFNLTNNSSANNTVFGTVVSGLGNLDAINALTTLNLAPQHQFVLVDTANVPITNPSTTSATFTPLTAGVYIRRTAVQMRIAAV